MIVSADKRVAPIMAYSDQNSFDADVQYYPGGLVEWLGNQSENVKDVRKNKLEQKPEVKKLWDKYANDYYDLNEQIKKNGNFTSGKINEDVNQNPLQPGETFEGCTTSYDRTIGPLLNTEWGQGAPFNNCTPSKNGCSHAKAGCVAIAIGQVMRYHEHPAKYDWSNMPFDEHDTSVDLEPVARLIADIGDAVCMNYGCTISKAKTKKGEDALEDEFGYSSASYGDFNIEKLKDQIDFNKPVILRAQRTRTNWGLFYNL